MERQIQLDFFSIFDEQRGIVTELRIIKTVIDLPLIFICTSLIHFITFHVTSRACILPLVCAWAQNDSTFFGTLNEFMRHSVIRLQ